VPEHVPIVSTSFAARDLATRRDAQGNPIDYHGCDEKAGHDPWGFCDHVRDVLRWPTGSIFIDKEAFGTYYQRTDPPQRPRLYLCGSPSRQFHVDVVVEDEDKPPLLIKRNYRKVYQWAQRVSSVAILFLSEAWVNTPNCRCELDDLIDLYALAVLICRIAARCLGASTAGLPAQVQRRRYTRGSDGARRLAR